LKFRIFAMALLSPDVNSSKLSLSVLYPTTYLHAPPQKKAKPKNLSILTLPLSTVSLK
jgi:hypothetical protein